MTAKELIPLITGILTILGVVVAVTRYLTQLQSKMRQEKLKAENELAQKRIEDVEARNRELLNDISIAKRVGSAALIRKLEIDDDLSTIMKGMQAQAGSIFIPIGSRPTQDPKGLVFLSIQPCGKQTEKLKKRIIPMQSIAGRCFTREKPYVSTNSKIDPEHYRKADLVSGYSTEDMVNYPLRHQGEIVGVLQLLNKGGPDRFIEDDIARVEPYAVPLAAKVSDFIRTPEFLEILGINADRDAEYATIMFCDLTSSSSLFRELSISVAVQHINEFLEKTCDIGLRYGSTVDKYTGDGVLLRFNVPRPVKDHPFKAVSAASEIISAFDVLKSEWITLGEPLSGVYARISLAYGEVYQAIVGHPQYQYLTVFGQTVNVAVNLCDAATRERNVVVIDQKLYEQLSGRIRGVQLTKERLGKALIYADSAYELQGLTE